MSVIQERIKVVWICHFTNEEVQKLIPVRKQRDEMAPWIPNLLKGFEDRNDIEIHVITPHEYLKKSTEIRLRNIYYHFIPYGIPFFHRHWPSQFKVDAYSDYYFFRKKIQRVVGQIKPHLINLIGTENPYYSTSILDFVNKYPVLIFIQGLISQFKDELNQSPTLKKRIKVEEKILKTFTYYCGDQDSSNYISTYNPSHIFFRMFFPVDETSAMNTEYKGKKFDCIYFGRMEKVKGVEDFVKVVAEIKKQKPDVKACIIGAGDSNPVKELSKQLNCFENIEFAGFLKSQKELFEYVKASKVFLAPPYKERISSTIREAMLLKVPVVAYATGGIPFVNEFDENIFLTETGDYKEMARKTLQLLMDEQLSDKLADRAYNYCRNEFSCKINSERLASAYRSILNKN
jgi:glycosyltransferase involved in cell wall biosynthesis